MKRDGNKQTLRPVLLDQRRHVARHRPCDRDLAAVFEPDRQASRNVVIRDRGPSARNPRRPRQADPAVLGLGRLEWKAAGRAACVAEEFDLFPAIGAEAVDVGDDNAAGGAARSPFLPQGTLNTDSLTIRSSPLDIFVSRAAIFTVDPK